MFLGVFLTVTYPKGWFVFRPKPDESNTKPSESIRSGIESVHSRTNQSNGI